MGSVAGADSIEHGNQVSDEQLHQMRDRGIFLDLTPTFYGGFFLKITEPSIVMSPAVHPRLRTVVMPLSRSSRANWAPIKARLAGDSA
jgi:hypothetical protein